jgi:hypothetical protein
MLYAGCRYVALFSLMSYGFDEVGRVAFTLLLPEVAGRDPDLVLAEELKERKP